MGVRSMRVALLWVVMVGASFMPASVWAYSKETHYFEMKAMALWAGLDLSIAEDAGAYNQWMDTSVLNSAMNAVGISGHNRASRLKHFPSRGVDPYMNLLQSVLNRFKGSEAHGDIKQALNVVRRNSYFANASFTEALKTGNRYLMWAAFHTLMDSYAHEGFNYIVGHAERGHYPDRPWMFVEKHNEMRKIAFLALTRIREILPANALSDKAYTKLGRPNSQLNAEELYASYIAIPEIESATLAIPHRDSLYTGEAASIILSELIDNGIIRKELRDYILTERRDIFFEEMADGSPRDGWDCMREIVKLLLNLPADKRDWIDMIKFEKETAGVPSEDLVLVGKNGKVVLSREEIKSVHKDIGESLVEEIVYTLCRNVIPVPSIGDADSSPSRKVIVENEKMYGVEEFIQAQRWKQVYIDVFGVSPGDLNENTWISTVLDTVRSWRGKSLDEVEENLAQLKKQLAKDGVNKSVSEQERIHFYVSMLKYDWVDFWMARGSSALKKMHLMSKVYGNVRLADSDVPDSKFWQHERLFKQLVEAGVFLSPYDAETVERMKEDRWRHERDFAPKLKAMREGQMESPWSTIERLRQTGLCAQALTVAERG